MEPKKSHTQTFELTMLSNGLDFLHSAVEHLVGKPDSRDLKYAILHLHAGVELILKERLQREHWSLIFADSKHANKAAYSTGDFRSVTFDDCINRLQNVVGIQLSEQQRGSLSLLRLKRNQLEHFGLVDHADALTSLAANALSATLDFVIAHFDWQQLNSADRKKLDSIRREVNKFNLFVRTRLEQIKEQLAVAGDLVVECMDCGQSAVVITHGTKCLFCGEKQGAEDAAVQYVFWEGSDAILDDPDNWPVLDCPNCEEYALVDREPLQKSPRYLCFGCGEIWDDSEISICPDCETRFIGDDGIQGFCATCFHEMEDDAGRASTEEE